MLVIFTARTQLRGTGAAVRVLVAATALLLALAVPAGAVEGPTQLFSPAASPRQATTTTSIALTVMYRNREGSPPSYVRVLIDGRAHAMASTGGANWKKGVGFRYATKLPAGVHKIGFTAADARRFSGTADGGSVTVKAAAPAPTPKPTATPKPAPKPAPTTAPNSAPDSAPSSTPEPDAAPDPGPGSAPAAGPDPGAEPTPPFDSRTGRAGGLGPSDPGEGTSDTTVGQSDARHESADENTTRATVVGVGPGAGPGPAAGAGPVAGGGPGPAVPGPVDGSSGGSANSDGRSLTGAGSTGWGTLASALGVQGWSPLQALPTLVGTAGAATMALAFALFGKKRRNEAPPAPDEVLRANSALGPAVMSSGDLVRVPADPEAAIPRWRRPSLIQARKADPSRSVSTAVSMSFEDRIAAGGPGRERRIVRYRVVRLLDAPDELRSAEIGQIDQGDEVELIERSGAYWHVLCPDGRQGWVHKMTLGDLAGEEPAPTVAEAWGADEIDSDVLSAFLTARNRA